MQIWECYLVKRPAYNDKKRIREQETDSLNLLSARGEMCYASV